MCNMTEAKLREHSDSRHPKNTFADCFPNFVSVLACVVSVRLRATPNNALWATGVCPPKS